MSSLNMHGKLWGSTLTLSRPEGEGIWKKGRRQGVLPLGVQLCERNKV